MVDVVRIGLFLLAAVGVGLCAPMVAQWAGARRGRAQLGVVLLCGGVASLIGSALVAAWDSYGTAVGSQTVLALVGLLAAIMGLALLRAGEQDG